MRVKSSAGGSDFLSSRRPWVKDILEVKPPNLSPLALSLRRQSISSKNRKKSKQAAVHYASKVKLQIPRPPSWLEASWCPKNPFKPKGSEWILPLVWSGDSLLCVFLRIGWLVSSRSFVSSFVLVCLMKED
ncbi:hypothetical protein TWF225_000769 [Orbilia oligospora]|nr:hypothetical protein TWF225_000769 [Orbilia oligospora]KAF3245606.1 hypothetical protein TWF217_010438 [Orbilia oligospora]